MHTVEDGIAEFEGRLLTPAAFSGFGTQLSFAHRSMSALATSKNGFGQCGSAGSGQSEAQITARQAASGRLAHQMCSVEICPCRMDFSRRACAEIRLIGRSTSMRRLG